MGQELNVKMTALADAIRAKTGEEDKLTLDQMAVAVTNISTKENLDTELDAQDELINAISELIAGKYLSEGSRILNEAILGRRITYFSTSSTYLRMGAFMGCPFLEWVDIPNVDNIQNYTFFQCSSMSRINMGNTRKINPYAFAYCKSLMEASASSCATIETQAFLGCSALTRIDFPIASSVNDRGFSACTSLTDVNLPICTYVSASAFAGCTSLSKINLPELSSMYTYAFDRCTALTDVSLPKATFIGKYTFQSCTALSTLTLPMAGYIDNYAFQYCSNLKSLYLLGTSKVCGIGGLSVFNGTPLSAGGNGNIYVPATLYSSYRTTTYWSSLVDRLVSVAGI